MTGPQTPTAMCPGQWLSLTVGAGLVAAWDGSPHAGLASALPAVVPGRRHPGRAIQRQQTMGQRHAGTAAHRPDRSRAISEALGARLEGSGVPPARVRRAVRATENLLDRALDWREDGAAFVITGDIPAMWLRDSGAQVAALLALADEVPEVVDLAAGVLRTQVEQVLMDPRANAFNPGPSGLAIHRAGEPCSPWVFERKYAVDSLCAPLWLAWRLWQASGRLGHVDARFREAAGTIVDLWRAEQQHDGEDYRFSRRFARREDSLSHGGRGAPVAWTGMTWSGFRMLLEMAVGTSVPSGSDLAAGSSEAGRTDGAADGPELAVAARQLAAEMRAGIADHGVVDVHGYGPIYAYEVDGLGHALLLDDANIPSCLSLPYLGFCDPADPLYQATRSWVLGSGNPCWSEGSAVRGVGSGHTRRGWVWPLAILVEGLTAIDADEREAALRRVEETVSGQGLLHESVHPADPRRFTRRWFSWADMLYVELVLRSAGVDVPERRPFERGVLAGTCRNEVEAKVRPHPRPAA